jgi:hypothetical protein
MRSIDFDLVVLVQSVTEYKASFGRNHLFEILDYNFNEIRNAEGAKIVL